MVAGSKFESFEAHHALSQVVHTREYPRIVPMFP
jgi:hypothetical protein